MKKIVGFCFFFLLGLSAQAQSKKWTLEECVNYALKNNISIKQTELDVKLSEIEKKTAFGAFLPTLNIFCGNLGHKYPQK